MEQENNNTTIQNGIMIDEERSSFNLLEWVFRILHYWYLFLIAGVIAFTLAYLKNKRVVENYLSTSTLIINEYSGRGYGSSSTLMQGFGVDAGYKNVNNQMIILGSYDLIARTVDSLPFMNVEYITQGRFKTRNIYRNTPILVEYSHLEPSAYSYLFKCTSQNDGSLLITSSE